MNTIIRKRMTCNKCGKKVFIPKSLWDINLGSCMCKECREKELGAAHAKYLTNEQGEIEVTWYKAVVQERQMSVACNKCNCSHAVSPLIFIDCTFKYSDGHHQRYEYGYIIPPKQYWCPLS
ncbi:MAG TPA: hypothetical protein VF817_01185 [Patescibacteria group bacterium]